GGNNEHSNEIPKLVADIKEMINKNIANKRLAEELESGLNKLEKKINEQKEKTLEPFKSQDIRGEQIPMTETHKYEELSKKVHQLEEEIDGLEEESNHWKFRFEFIEKRSEKESSRLKGEINKLKEQNEKLMFQIEQTLDLVKQLKDNNEDK